MRTLRVLIDDERWARLEQEAERRRVSVSVLVREAIDERYPSDTPRRRAALRAALGAAPMEVPPPRELRRELELARAGRFD